MLRLALLSTLMVSAALAASCDPYDPSLPDVPFQCGTDEPRCPDGYQPVDVTPVRCECHQTASTSGGDGDTCGDTSEPNNDITIATATAIDTGPSTSYTDLAVCPADDVDLFRMIISRVGTKINVQVDYAAGEDPPAVDVLDSAGNSVRPTNTMMTGRVTAAYSATSSGTYYAKVSAGTVGMKSHYNIKMTVMLP